MDITQIVALVGGEAVVLAAFVVIMKKVFNRIIDNAIDNSFAKSLEKYRNQLSRANAARTLVLNREMEFYQKIDAQLADLVPLVQDMKRAARENLFGEFEKKCFARYFGLIPEMKDCRIRYEAYVDSKTAAAFSDLIIAMQDNMCFWSNVAKSLSSGSEMDAEAVNRVNDYCDETLKQIALVRVRQGEYLNRISDFK